MLFVCVTHAACTVFCVYCCVVCSSPACVCTAGGGGGVKAGRGPSGRRDEEGESFFDARKRELAASAAETAAALAKAREGRQGVRGFTGLLFYSPGLLCVSLMHRFVSLLPSCHLGFAGRHVRCFAHVVLAGTSLCCTALPTVH